MKKVTLKLDQPDVHATYRNSFWAVDCYNRLCFGPEGTHRVVKVQMWHRRFFLALISMAVTNAYFAFNHARKAAGLPKQELSEFKHDLAMGMLNRYTTRSAPHDGVSRALSKSRSPTPVVDEEPYIELSLRSWVEEHGHAYLY